MTTKRHQCHRLKVDLQDKKNLASKIDKYKVQLIICGFTQVQGVDYYEMYMLVTYLSFLCLILAITTCHNWDIDVFDFHSAFLNGKLDDNEIIYMELPPSFNKCSCDLVAQLCIALYGSKQGTLKWYQWLCKELDELGLK